MMNGKAEYKHLKEIKQEIKRCALYDDFKELYNKTLMPMQKYEKQMFGYQLEHQQMQLMIRQFDETLALKANKTDFMGLENQMEFKITMYEVEELETKTKEKIDELKKKILNQEF